MTKKSSLRTRIEKRDLRVNETTGGRRRVKDGRKSQRRKNYNAFLCFARFAIFVLIAPGAAYAEQPGKALIVVAHPDDEYYCASTVYKMAVQLGGRVDELIITNGEGGFRYSTLAAAYYKKQLTNEAVGRRELPAIRRREAVNAGKVLGIRSHYFLDQVDRHFTTDERDGTKYGWNSDLITSRLQALIRKERYKYVFALLPRATSHGYHQAATALAASAIQALPSNIRPVLLGFDTSPARFEPSPTELIPQKWQPDYHFAFDRTTKFGFHDALSYQIVVDWMIAEHKSQGLLQTMDGRDPKEYIWVDLSSDPQAQKSADALFRLLGQDITRNGR
ncbi:PIG-L family deacetylase [Acidobacteria bacterium AB60]|nr:PIG-L family deacetylase [Acidobacteria bacterium AB60]